MSFKNILTLNFSRHFRSLKGISDKKLISFASRMAIIANLVIVVENLIEMFDI